MDSRGIQRVTELYQWDFLPSLVFGSRLPRWESRNVGESFEVMVPDEVGISGSALLGQIQRSPAS